MSITPKILISGGGTGGHVFPAIAIADAIKG
jgi:UDP-N-acetylglucosamine--N-acetylmuramyl-(pentapeptide) pyrophosphoryl-undecaprenol N-acetylglucosamine transferase